MYTRELKANERISGTIHREVRFIFVKTPALPPLYNLARALCIYVRNSQLES